MERRNALKYMATAAVGLVAAPAWATGWNTTSILPQLAPAPDAVLAELVGVILPKTDTPGAKELGLNLFVQKMVADCYDQAAQKTLTDGLTALDSQARKQFSTGFAAATDAQRLTLVQQLAASQDADQQTFYKLVKGLAIRGYMSSEYVMTNLTHFQMAPGYYKGCVPVTPKSASPTSPTKTR